MLNVKKFVHWGIIRVGFRVKNVQKIVRVVFRIVRKLVRHVIQVISTFEMKIYSQEHVAYNKLVLLSMPINAFQIT